MRPCILIPQGRMRYAKTILITQDGSVLSDETVSRLARRRFSQKNKLFFFAMKVCTTKKHKFIHLFFGRIYSPPICLRSCLTFNIAQKTAVCKRAVCQQACSCYRAHSRQQPTLQIFTISLRSDCSHSSCLNSQVLSLVVHCQWQYCKFIITVNDSKVTVSIMIIGQEVLQSENKQ